MGIIENLRPAELLYILGSEGTENNTEQNTLLTILSYLGTEGYIIANHGLEVTERNESNLRPYERLNLHYIRTDDNLLEMFDNTRRVRSELAERGFFRKEIEVKKFLHFFKREKESYYQTPEFGQAVKELDELRSQIVSVIGSKNLDKDLISKNYIFPSLYSKIMATYNLNGAKDEMKEIYYGNPYLGIAKTVLMSSTVDNNG